MRHLLTFLLFAASAFAQTATITDTIATPFAGTFSGTVTVTLNSPALAQPLYSGNVTLSGWTQTVTVTAGAFALTLYTNDLITPGGTSYTATYAPTSGSGWKETWIVPTGATTIREIRSTTVPSPSVRLTPSQITQAGATLGQGLRWNGSIWAPAAVLTDPMTTTGDLITRSGINAVRLGIGSAGQVLTVAGGLPTWAAPATNGTVTSVSVTTANGVSGTVATATSTPAITLSLGAITPSSVAATGTVTGSNLSGTNTGDQTSITGNAGTATALAANGTNCSAGSFPLGVDASGNAESCTAAVTASTGLSDSADIVRGGAALSTTGSVPFVTAAGVLGQSGNVFWDSGSSRFRIGGTVAGLGEFRNASNAVVAFYGTASGFMATGTATDLGLRSTSAILFATNGDNERARFTTTGNLLLGTTTDGNFRLDVGSSGSSGTTRIYDQTPTTGSTSLVVRAGAGQSGNDLTQFVTLASGTSGVRSNGVIYGGTSVAIGTVGGSANPFGVLLGSGADLRWSNAAAFGAGTPDLALSRASANTLQVGDGSANSNGTILARIHTWANGTEGTCDATLRGQVVMVQGGAGVADTFRICRKDATDTYLRAAVDNNVALQVVSAGPTATVTNQVRRVYVDPASVIASLTLTLPATPLDADQVQVYFGGTLANQAAVVTTLSIAPNTGQAISAYSLPVRAFGGDMATFEYRAAAARWYRIQ